MTTSPTQHPTTAPAAEPDPGTAAREFAAAERILAHLPHPHLARRAAAGPPTAARHLPGGRGALARFNTWLGVKITGAVGTMQCAYVFAALALVSLPAAIKGGTSTIVSWTAQTFLQLVLLSIIMVGQNVQTAAGDARAKATYEDGEAILHYADSHSRSLAELHTKLEQGLAHVHTKLDDNLDAMHGRLDQVALLAAQAATAAASPTAAGSTASEPAPQPGPPPGPPPSAAPAAPVPQAAPAPPETPPAAAAGTGSTS